MSTIVWIVWPFSLMSMYINLSLSVFYYFVLIFSPTLTPQPIRGSYNSSLSLLDSELLKIWAKVLPLFDLGGWINIINVLCAYFCVHSLTMCGPPYKKHPSSFVALPFGLNLLWELFFFFCLLLNSFPQEYLNGQFFEDCIFFPESYEETKLVSLFCNCNCPNHIGDIFLMQFLLCPRH